MRAGALRRRVTFQRPSNTVSSEGKVTRGYVNDSDMWAEVTANSGLETIVDGKIEARNPYTLSVRYRSDVTTKWRLLYGSLTLQIVDIQDVDERHRELAIGCKALNI